MSVDVSWFDSNRHILHYCFSGEWNWNDYFVALTKGREMMSRVPYMTCLINDFSQTLHLPGDFIEQARSISLSRPANLGVAVFISADYQFHAVYDILCALYPDTTHEYPLVNTLEEALALIADWFEQNAGAL